MDRRPVEPTLAAVVAVVDALDVSAIGAAGDRDPQRVEDQGGVPVRCEPPGNDPAAQTHDAAVANIDHDADEHRPAWIRMWMRLATSSASGRPTAIRGSVCKIYGHSGSSLNANSVASGANSPVTSTCSCRVPASPSDLLSVPYSALDRFQPTRGDRNRRRCRLPLGAGPPLVSSSHTRSGSARDAGPDVSCSCIPSVDDVDARD